MNTRKLHLNLRPLKDSDCERLARGFALQGWEKPASQYRDYLKSQASGQCVVVVAEAGDALTGYLTIRWASRYSSFREKNIPEINDLNVLKRFQRRKIGTALMDEAEHHIASVSPVAGIGVGLHADYGPAQVLYASRGYVPDGRGLIVEGRSPRYGESFELNDEVVLYLTKQLR